jgi:4-amino-4-deoxy-L-arabinose transferase-like glycosyltransferase
LAILLVAGLAVAQYAWNAWAVTPLTGYDAGGHAGYVLTILDEGRLPHPEEGWSTFHPPLYYLLGSGAWWALEPLGPRSVVAGLRAIGGLALLAAGWVVFALCRRTGVSLPVAAVATGVFLFVPCVQMAGAMIGNEALAAGLAALALVPILDLQRDPRRPGVALLAGALAGAAFATKASGLFVLVACAVPFLGAHRDRARLRALAAAAAAALVVAGPVTLRHLALTGSLFPSTAEVAAVRHTEDADVLRPRRVKDYLWLDPACLVRPSIHQVAGPPGPPPRRNPSMANVWGLAYASTWYDAFGHRIPVAQHRDGVLAGPLLALLGVVPTAMLLYGLVLALRDAFRTRGRSRDAPLAAMWLAGLAAFAAFTWITPTLSAGKGSYLLPLAAPGAVLFARAVSSLGCRARGAVLAVSCAAALAAAVVFSQALVFAPIAPETMAARWRLVGSTLPGAHISEAVDRLVVGPGDGRSARLGPRWRERLR